MFETIGVSLSPAFAPENEGAGGESGGSGQQSGEPADSSSQGTAAGQGGQDATAGGQGGQDSTGTLLSSTPAPEPGATEGQDDSKSASDEGTGVLAYITDQQLKQDPNLQHINSVEDLAKSYVHAQKLVGKDKIALPSDENDTEAWKDVFSKLGRPDAPEDYQLPDLSEDARAEVPQETSDWFKQTAHELGLTNKQARELYSRYVTEVQEANIERLEQQGQQRRQEAEKELRKEFGNAFDDKLGDAQRAIQTYAPDGFVQRLEETGLGNDPALIKMLSQIGEQLREDKIGGSATQFSRTPEQAKAEINEMKADSSFMAAYNDRNNPGHKAAVEKMNRLYQEAFPGT